MEEFAHPNGGGFENRLAEDPTMDDDIAQEELIIPTLVYRAGPDVSAASQVQATTDDPEHRAERKAAALDRIRGISFEFKSVLSSVDA
jgi:hypothetical protein